MLALVQARKQKHRSLLHPQPPQQLHSATQIRLLILILSQLYLQLYLQALGHPDHRSCRSCQTLKAVLLAAAELWLPAPVLALVPTLVLAPVQMHRTLTRPFPLSPDVATAAAPAVVVVIQVPLSRSFPSLHSASVQALAHCPYTALVLRPLS